MARMTALARDNIDRPPPGRRGMPAGRAVVVILVTLLLWTLLYAPELVRSARAHPEGIRRTVSLAILEPFAWTSRHVGLTVVTDAAARAAGRDPNAQVGADGDSDVEPLPPAPSSSGRPSPAPTHDTPIRVPARDRPLRVVVVGDSLAQGIGYFAERVFRPGVVDVRRQGRISTGLARPDYFDWMAAMQLIVDRYHPDLTIVLLGENDNQALRWPSGSVEAPIGQATWPPAYEARVERFARIATSEGGHVIWAGLPVVRDKGRWMLLQRQNSIYEAVASRLPNVTYVDSWDLFDTRDGGYAAYYRDGGRVRLVRSDDGVHFNSAGYMVWMRQIVRTAAEAFALDPTTVQ